MAITVGILGQEKPAASTVTILYTVPTDKRLSFKMSMANSSGSAETVSVWLIPSADVSGGPLDKHLVASGETVGANASVTSVAWTLTDGGQIRVESSGGAISFMVNGILQDT